MIEFSSRRTKDRRKNPCYIEKDRRANERRGLAARELEKKRRKEFERHLSAQR